MQRIAVVTGGTRGIGAAIARKLQASGHRVVATYAGNEDAAQSMRESCGIDCERFDVSDIAQVEEGFRRIAANIGPVDVLVNNAGITRDAFLHKMTPQQWGEVIATNLTGAFNTCRLAVPLMRERGFGRIVNISSINGQKGQIGQTNYAAAKAGLIGFTRALALESAAKGITVNVVAPGYIETEMTGAVDPKVLEGIVRQIPAGRLGSAEEIAALTDFLCSDQASFINGAVLSANGGHYMG